MTTWGFALLVAFVGLGLGVGRRSAKSAERWGLGLTVIVITAVSLGKL